MVLIFKIYETYIFCVDAGFEYYVFSACTELNNLQMT